MSTILQEHHREILLSHLHETIEQLDSLDRLNLLTLLCSYLTYNAWAHTWESYSMAVGFDDLTPALDPTLEFTQCRDVLSDLELNQTEAIALVKKLLQQVEPET